MLTYPERNGRRRVGCPFGHRKVPGEVASFSGSVPNPGTSADLHALGFVVRHVERALEALLPPKGATNRAKREVARASFPPGVQAAAEAYRQAVGGAHLGTHRPLFVAMKRALAAKEFTYPQACAEVWAWVRATAAAEAGTPVPAGVVVVPKGLSEENAARYLMSGKTNKEWAEDPQGRDARIAHALTEAFHPCPGGRGGPSPG